MTRFRSFSRSDNSAAAPRRLLAARDAILKAPELKPGDVVVMDNLSSHKSPAVRAMIAAAAASLLYLPPYSPGL